MQGICGVVLASFQLLVASFFLAPLRKAFNCGCAYYEQARQLQLFGWEPNIARGFLFYVVCRLRLNAG
jgi:hypothetical protein